MNNEKNFLSLTASIAIPVALQAVLQSSFGVVDQLMIGQLGSASIAAVGLAGKFVSIFTIITMAIASGAGILFAQYVGQKRHEDLSRSFCTNFVFNLILAIIFLLPSVLIPTKIMSIYTIDPETIDIAGQYLKILAIGFFPLAGTAILAAYLRCVGKAVLPLYTGIFSALCNSILNYFLIFGKGGFPTMGVNGAALATIISQYAGFFVLFLLMIFIQKNTADSISVIFMKDRLQLRQYLFILAPLLLTEFFWSMGENVYAIIYGHLGTASCAAMTLTVPVQSILIGAMSGFGQAASVIVGKTLGEGDTQRVMKEAKRLIFYTFCGSSVLSVLLILTARYYISIYSVDTDIARTAVNLLYLYAIFVLVKVQNMVIEGGILRSGGKTSYVFFIDLIGTWGFGVWLGLISAFIFKMPITGVYFFLSLEEILRLFLSLLLLKSRRWIKIL